jgi:tRNA-specific 2-thiouridylase
VAERVAVAMSGGVDSSVAAALLMERGYEVVGLTMQLWPREAEEEACPGVRGCCGLEAIDDARRVARVLGIRHYVLDLREAFQRAVIDPFCDSYLQGQTPNPCILCNTYVKYQELLRRAELIGATRLATGHYVRVGYDAERGRWVLRRAADERKDQSYVLYDLTQGQLAKALFPVGSMTKTEVRARAARLGLPVSEKPESQQICFVSERGYGEYLERQRPGEARPGAVVNRAGRQLGVHRGIHHYTVGQRHGLGIASARPLYVVAVEAEANRLVVGEEEELAARGLVMTGVNWVAQSGLPPGGLALQVKIRSASDPAPCRARPEGEGVVVEFEHPVRAVTPGQAAVCYDGEAVAFGGVIASALREEE